MAEGRTPGGFEMIGLVARREIRERMRAKSFLVGTLLLVVLIVGGGFVVRLIGAGDGAGAIDVGVTAAHSDRVASMVEAVAEAMDRDASVTFYDDLPTARSAVEEGDVDVVVVPDEGQVLFAEDVDDEVLAIVQRAWSQLDAEQRLADAGLDTTQIEEVLAAPPYEAVTLDGDDELSGLGVLTGTVAAVLLFISLQTFGTYVLTGVVEEKSSAVVEILLVRASSGQLLAGKVIGIGTTALAQFAAAVASALAALAISGIDVPGEIWSALPMMLVWFLGGFALYSTLFALAGSLVSRQEDAQAAAAPIGYALVGAYLLVFVFGYMPESTASIVLSLLPPIAPFLMPIRMALGAASILEVAVAVVGMLAATWGAWRLAGPIYEQVLLRRGSRIGWRDAFRMLRS